MTLNIFQAENTIESKTCVWAEKWQSTEVVESEVVEMGVKFSSSSRS